MQSDDDKKAWLGQPTIIKGLEKQFGERVAKKKMTVTPGMREFRQPIQVQSHLEMPGILVQLGHIQQT